MRRRLLAFAGALATLLAGAPAGRGEDRVTVHGAYYREPSTKVVQPMVQLTKDLPYGIDAGAHFLVDAISSASIAAGAGTDQIFTEYRKEVGLTTGVTIDRSRVGVAYKDSHEPDYISRTAGVSLAQGVWENSGTIAVNGAYGHDIIGPNLNQYLDVGFGSVSYAQALSPTLLVQVGYEAVYLKCVAKGADAFGEPGSPMCLGNPYLQVPNLGREKPPARRLRHVLVGRVAQYFPSLVAGVQLHYRFYTDRGVDDSPDPWKLTAHTFEARLYKSITPELEVRLAYRYHSQGAAAFWCQTDPSRGGRTDCYGTTPRYFVSDPKLGPLATHIPEMKLIWEARRLNRIPFVGWFAAGAFEVSYGYFFQDTRFANAHLLQTGYTLPF